MSIVRYRSGDVIVEQGTTGEEFFIVKKGRVEVYKN